MIKYWNAIVIFTLLALTGWSPTAVSSQPPLPARLLVDSAETRTLAELSASGARQLAGYDGFSLWQPAAASALPETLASRPGVSVVDDAILLRDITLHPGEEPARSPSTLAQQPPAADGLWLVQFAGPVQPEWTQALADAGLEIVTYLPNHAYLVWGNQPASALNRLSAAQPVIRWNGAYHPLYRLAPDLRDLASAPAAIGDLSPGVDVTIQFYNTPHLKSSLAQLSLLAETILQPPSSIAHLTNIRMRLAPAHLAAVAAWPDVINIEPYQPPQLLDEIQGQILAGQIQQVNGRWQPTGPGYLNWLAAKGFPTDPNAYPLVDIVDDGLDNGSPDNVLHPDFYVLGSPANPDRVAYIANCTADPSGNGVGGHGNLNAGIMMGYNNATGSPYQDAQGYRYGLGISPFGPVASTKVFKNNGAYDMSRCGSSDQRLVEQSYNAGARITSNSWGTASQGAYTADSQIYDYLTRDAVPAPGNQEMLHIFAAGNKGPSLRTIDSPGTAKNVLTVGATENVRDHGLSDRCGESNAANADNIARFSSRGPARDGRAKPDIVAPGTHITGPASQDPAFTGATVCGQYTTPYYPTGQRLYSWSSGTSHSTPAISGVAQLASNYYARVLAPGQVASPAMLKALILNTPRYLNGLASGDTLPSLHQGWGDADLSQMFDATPRTLIDQSKIFTASGQEHSLVGVVHDPTRPLRVTLVWTDAPGSPAAAVALVNDLDLEVTLNGQTYRGNAFSGAFSIPSSASDSLNNVESVFLPAGVQGPFRVRVLARNLAGDGVPGNDSLTDQDFALIIYNSQPSVPYLAIESQTWNEIYGNRNNAIDPGETYAIQVRLKNLGSLAASGISARLESPDPRLTLQSDPVTFGDIPPSAAADGDLAFRVKIDPAWPCGQALPLILAVSYNNISDRLALPPTPVGRFTSHSYAAADLPARVPDFVDPNPGQVDVPFQVPDSFKINDLDVMVDIAHTWDEDLVLLIQSPSGQETILAKNRGGMEDNFQETIFDDQATRQVQNGVAPFLGRFRPEQPLSAHTGQPSVGRWLLRVQDLGAGDIGWVNTARLDFNEVNCSVYTARFEARPLPSQPWRGGLPGTTVSFIIQVENISSQPDTFDIHLTASRWWVQSVSAIGPLAPGEQQTFTLQVSIPPAVQTGEYDDVLLDIISRSQPDLHVQLQLRAQVHAYYWLPLILGEP